MTGKVVRVLIRHKDKHKENETDRYTCAYAYVVGTIDQPRNQRVNNAHCFYLPRGAHSNKLAVYLYFQKGAAYSANQVLHVLSQRETV